MVAGGNAKQLVHISDHERIGKNKSVKSSEAIGGEAEQPQTFIIETIYVKVAFHMDHFPDQVIYAKYFQNW